MSIIDQLFAEREAKVRMEAQMEGRREGRMEGLMDGEKIGAAQGRKQGRANQFEDQLRYRFGDVPPSISQRIRGAEEAHLKVWGTRIFNAKSIEEVFATTR
jgi:hypothetical protein